MNRKSFLALALSAALPVFAAEPAPQQPQPPVEESPLVAAARRSGRLGKKPAFVITNATLAQSQGKGHITTTTTPRTLNVPVPVSREVEARVVVQKEKDAAQKAVAAAKAKSADSKPPLRHDDAEVLFDDDSGSGNEPAQAKKP